MGPQIVVLDRLDQLLAPPRSIDAGFMELLQVLFDRRYTGKVVLHFHDGVAKVAEFPAPQIRLVTNGNGQGA